MRRCRTPSPDRATRRARRCARRGGGAPLGRAVVGLALVAGALASVPGTAGSEAPTVRALRFPVEGPVTYRDDFGEARSGGRRHEGNDLMGRKLQPLLATTDGTVTWLRTDDGRSGNALAITDADGWVHWYLHVNNDSPGTDDGRNPPEWAFAPGIALKATVRAGQRVGYLGDSGNAEGTGPHLHFELHRPDHGGAVSPYASLRAAQGLPAPPSASPPPTTRPSPTTRPVPADRPVSQAPPPRAVARTVARPSTSSARAVANRPGGGFYVLTGDGTVHAYDGAPSYGSPRFPSDFARSLAVAPDGAGYVVLDAWGGLHKFGSARTGALAKLRGPYWPGQDRARAVVVTPSGRGQAVLEASGAVHAAGDAPPGRAAAWPGRDLARDLALSPSGRGTYVLDAWGGVHVSGDAVRRPTAYFPGLDVARRVVVTPTNRGSAVLDAWGALHLAGDAARPVGGSYAVGSSWRGLAAREGSYLVLRSDGLAEVRPTDVRARLSASPDDAPPEGPAGP